MRHVQLPVLAPVFCSNQLRMARAGKKLSGGVREIEKCAKDLAIGCNERGAEILRQTDELAVTGRAAGRHSEVQHVMRDDAIFTACHPAFSLVDHSTCRFERHHVVVDKPQHRVSEFRTPQEGERSR
jgi:hypothetical protein